MRELVSYTDFLAICTARNERQARAIVDEVRVQVKQEMALLPGGVDGGGEAGWIVARLSRLRPPRLHRRGPRSLPARGSLARGAAPGARPRRARGTLRRQRLSLGPPPSESRPARTVPRMGSFKRALFGYRRPEVDAAMAAADGRIGALEAAGRRVRAPSGGDCRAWRVRLSVSVGHGDRARARDPRPRRAAARGQRTPRPQHRLARRGLGPARGDQRPGPRPGDPDPDESAARGGRGEQAGAGADRGAKPARSAADDRGQRQRHARHATSTASSRAWSSSRSARSATSPSWSASRTRSVSSAPPRSRSSASPRAGRRSRCAWTSRSSCCASSRSSPCSTSRSATPRPDNLILDVDEDAGPRAARRLARRHSR